MTDDSHHFNDGEGTTEQDPFDPANTDRVVFWFGIRSTRIFMLLFLAFVAGFGGYVLVSDGFPPLAPLLVSILTAIGVGAIASARQTSKCVLSSGGRIDGEDREGDQKLPPSTTYGIPLWLVVVSLTLIWIIQPMVVFIQTNHLETATFLVLESLVAGAIAYTIMVEATFLVITTLEGNLPNDLSGRFWETRLKDELPLHYGWEDGDT